jgi:Fe2+ or Zn2+ uptake regulation protein
MAALAHAAGDSGFTIERANIEAVGLCPVCKAAA